MNKYKVIMMAYDGSIVTDSEHDTIEDANDAASELGSKWIFYPYYFCVKGKTVVDAAGCFVNMVTGEPTLSKLFKGKRIDTVRKVFKRVSEMEEAQGCDIEDFESLIIDTL